MGYIDVKITIWERHYFPDTFLKENVGTCNEEFAKGQMNQFKLKETKN
jgi:hypothetical protein